jgi:uncharacterized protein
MNRLYYTSMVLVLGIMAGLISCNENKETSDDNRFDREEMLENFSENLIIPAYTDLNEKLATLLSNTSDFVQNPNANSLGTLQNAWEAAYLSWQFANAFNFGPAGEQGLRKALLEEVGTFPVSIEKIENAITGTPNFNDFNRDARGFLAVEYLIFGINQTSAELVEAFSEESRRNFLLGAVTDIERRVKEVLTSWNNGYAAEFTRNAGTDVGSSTSMFYNEFVKSFESIKNFKLGLPLGRRPGQTQAEPQLVEAFYSGKSLTMLSVHLTAIENIWYGRSNDGKDGTGFREYLESVEGGDALVAATELQMLEVKAALAAVPSNPTLANQIQNAPQPADRLHTELQRHTRFYKSDMSSLLGIAITFSSGDGD